MIEFRQKLFSEYDAMRQLYVELKKCGADRFINIIDTSSLIPVLRGNNIVIEKFVQATRVFGKDRYRMYIKIGAKAKMPDDVRLPQYSIRKSLGNLQLSLNYGIMPEREFIAQNNNNDNKNSNSTKEKAEFTSYPESYASSNQKGTKTKLTKGEVTSPDYNDSYSSSADKFKKKGYGKTKTSTWDNIDPKYNYGKGGYSVTKKFSEVVFKQKEFKGGGGGAPPFAKVEFRPNVEFLNYQVHKLLADAIKYDKKDRSLVLECDSIQDAIKALNILPFGMGYKIYLLNS